MDIPLKPLLAIAFSLVLLTSCQKAKTKLTDLPPATQEGKNTFGCVIDGKAFIAQYNLFTKSAVDSQYGYIDYNVSTTDHYFRVFGSDTKDKGLYMRIYANKLDIKGGGIYPIQNKQDSGAYAEYEPSIIYTSTTGELKITRFDLANSIASGTFWFDAENDKGEKVEVRDGRFDARINE
jgi:hypothetical protein